MPLSAKSQLKTKRLTCYALYIRSLYDFGLTPCDDIVTEHLFSVPDMTYNVFGGTLNITQPQHLFCCRDETRVLSAGDVQSSLSQPQRCRCYQISDVRSYARRSLHRGQQSYGPPTWHTRLSGWRHWLRQSPVLRQDALWHLRTKPWTSQLQTLLQPTHHVSRSVILLPLR